VATQQRGALATFLGLSALASLDSAWLMLVMVSELQTMSALGPLATMSARGMMIPPIKRVQLTFFFPVGTRT
jgi:hypothetical protein